ncbi:polysaccharide deacetylase family protein [Glaciecola sp. 2405UD65-10]|uniref:polysaccharide deacetylase family protein n=1 Tax=Glaciecola sp. 2405UD65-10 TaxID=3397244 RepID=UPI003B59F9B5
MFVHRNVFNFFLILIGSLIAQAAFANQTIAESPNHHNLVILQYHHVSSDTPASTSVSTAVFESHMALLSEGYKVVDLSSALKKIQNGQALEDKSVAITFDDGYTNILENAHPILSKYNFPYTVFINPSIIGESSAQLTWEQVKSMQDLATFANHTLDHAHLLARNPNESSEQVLKRSMNNIEMAENIISDNIGYSKKWLAYPYGEFNLRLKNALLDAGYIGFGQQSGAVSRMSDFGALPRFPAAGVYANINSLKVKLNSLAMPVTQLTPAKVEFSSGEEITGFTLTVKPKDIKMGQFACYFQGKTLELDIAESSVNIKLPFTMKAGRMRVNCTAPSKQLSNRYYWFSHAMFTATESGEFLD